MKRDESIVHFAVAWFAAGVATCLVVMTVLVGAKNNIEGVSPENIARCKSLQGEYGGGKCFKDGKEV